MRLRQVVIWFECLVSGTMAPRSVINEKSKSKMDELTAMLERRIIRWHGIRTPDDMHRPTAAYGLCFILLAFVIPISIGLRSCSTPQDRLADLINKIRVHEDAIMSVVRAVQSRGEADAESKALTQANGLRFVDPERTQTETCTSSPTIICGRTPALFIEQATRSSSAMALNRPSRKSNICSARGGGMFPIDRQGQYRWSSKRRSVRTPVAASPRRPRPGSSRETLLIGLAYNQMTVSAE